MNDQVFCGDTFLQDTFTELVREHKPDMILETGTYLGDTTVFLGSFGIPVLTVEINQDFRAVALTKFKELPNITSALGDAASVLSEKFEEIRDKKIIAFIDAHWRQDMAAERELSLLSHLTHKPVILVHDFYVPGTDFGYDSHDGHRYDLESFRWHFDLIYGKDKWNYRYNTQASGLKRGVVILTAKDEAQVA